MKVICMDCRKDLGEKDGHGVEGVSHGLCDECYEQRKTEIRAMKEAIHV